MQCATDLSENVYYSRRQLVFGAMEKAQTTGIGSGDKVTWGHGFLQLSSLGIITDEALRGMVWRSQLASRTTALRRGLQVQPDM